MIFDFLIGLTAESKSLAYRKQVISTLRPDVIGGLGRYASVDDLIEVWASENGRSLSEKTKDLLGRLLAIDIHEAVDKQLKQYFKKLEKVSVETRKAEYLILHPYIWGEMTAETVRAQCWGKIGTERKQWLGREEQSATACFGAAREFERKIVSESTPLYEIVEVISKPLDAKLLKLVASK